MRVPLWVVFRPTHWLYFVPLPLAAVVEAHGDVFLRPLAYAAAVLAASGSLAFAYGLNVVSDASLDANPKKNPFAGGRSVPVSVRVALGLVAGGTLGVAVLLGWLGFGLVVASLLFGCVYSAGPRLKRYPWVGTAVNLGIFAPLPALLLAAPPTPRFGLLAYTFVVLLAQNQLLHELADVDEDRRGGVRTTATQLSPRLREFVSLLSLPAILLTTRFHVGIVSNALAGAAIATGAIALGRLERAGAGARRVHHRYISIVFGVALFVALFASAPP